MVRTDNQAAAADWEKRNSKSEDVHEKLLELWRTCSSLGVQLRVSWLPREENKLADFWSKCWGWDLRTDFISRVSSMWPERSISLAAPHEICRILSNPRTHNSHVWVIPTWEKASWWSLLQTHGWKSRHIGKARSIVKRIDNLEPPPWKMLAVWKPI